MLLAPARARQGRGSASCTPERAGTRLAWLVRAGALQARQHGPRQAGLQGVGAPAQGLSRGAMEPALQRRSAQEAEVILTAPDKQLVSAESEIARLKHQPDL
jgi:hypothetical protein